MKRVLFVSFFFPPINAVGSVRAAKLAKYLPDYGWEPTVLTVDQFATRPATMAVETPEDHIARARYLDPVGLFINFLRPPTGRPAAGSSPQPIGRRRFLYSLARKLFDFNVVRVPDRSLTWFLSAVKKGMELIRQGSFDAILSTYPPPTDFMVAAFLSRRTSVPWVAEYRDPWTSNNVYNRAQPIQYLEEQLEKRLLRNAAMVETVSVPNAELLSEALESPVSVITNGFDPEDYLAAPTPHRQDDSGKLTITYTGSLHAGKQDPSLLFEAIRRLREKGRIRPEDLEIQFYTFDSDRGDLLALVERYTVSAFVQCRGFFPHQEALSRQRESDALLMLDWMDPADPGYYSLKLFEYLGARRPILAIGNRSGSIVDELLRACSAGEVLFDIEKVQSQIMKWVTEFRSLGRIIYHGSSSATRKFSYHVIAGQLAEVLDNAIESGHQEHGNSPLAKR